MTFVGFMLSFGLFSFVNAQTAPSGLTATVGECGKGTVNLSWTDNSGGVAHFSIIRVGGVLNGKNASVYQAQKGQSSYSVTNIKGDIKHKFYIAACNDGSCSDLISSSEVNPSTSCSSANYSVTVASSGKGSGTIIGKNGDSEVINCGSDCYEGNILYDKTGKITLTATPNSDSVFSKWIGDSECNNSTSATCSLSKTKKHNGVKAVFNKIKTSSSSGVDTFTLNLSKNGNGSGSIQLNNGDKTCDFSSACSFTFSKGKKVFITIIPDSNSKIMSAGGVINFNNKNNDNCTLASSENKEKDCYVTMNGNKSITINFDTKVSSGGSSVSSVSVSSPTTPIISFENVAANSAKLKIKINNGGDKTASVYVYYMKDGDSSWTEAAANTINLSGDQTLSVTISSLSASTKYYYGAKVTNSAGSATSNTSASFRTSSE